MSHSTESSTQSISLLDLNPQYLPLRDQILAAVTRVCDSQHFILGPEVNALEASIAEYGHSKYAISCASGSDALLLALMALNVGAGDLVITTSYTFFATAGAIVRLGAVPVFLDIELNSYNLSPTRLEEFLTSLPQTQLQRVKAIIPVHLFGRCADMDPILEIANRYRIPVIEDAAQAIGSEYKGRRAGTMGVMGCFSFFPSKNLGAFGDAGILTTDDLELAEKLRVLRVHGSKPKYFHRTVGINSRLDALQAAILRIKLPHLDSWTRQRQQNARLYDEKLGGINGLILPDPPAEGERHIYNQYVIRTDRRDALRAYLAERGIGSEIYYPVPLHKQECFASIPAVAPNPNSETAAEQTLAIPIYPGLSATQIDYVAETIRAFYEDR